MNVCTSFSPGLQKIYGERFIESWKRHSDVPLFVFHEGPKPDLRGVELVSLDADRDRKEFIGTYGDKPFANGFVCKDGQWFADYRFQCVRFSHKVFAMTWPDRPKGQWVWCDADVIVERDLDKWFWAKAAPTDVTCSYLGRKDWDHSETGWLAFTDPVFCNALREWYMSGAVFQLPGFTDSFVFDAVRKQWEENRRGTFLNLSDGVPGNDVWPHTVLGKYMAHNKGPVAKQRAYAE